MKKYFLVIINLVFLIGCGIGNGKKDVSKNKNNVAYDKTGRVIKDNQLTYEYDDNGNLIATKKN